jgi:predicted membrane protein DUF2157
MADQLRRSAGRWGWDDHGRTEVQRWVDAGIVSSAQGEEILALESSESGEARDDRSRSGLSPIIELVSYILIVAVGLSTLLFLGHYWSGLSRAGHVSVALMVTVAGVLGGFVVAQFGDAGARRLSGFLRLIGTAGAAMATGFAVGPVAEHHRGLALLCVGGVIVAMGAALWRNLDRPLQFLSTLLGLALALGGVGTVARLQATSIEVALFVWLLAAAVGLMSLQMLRPARTALVVGVLGSFMGAFALSFPNHLGGVLLGLLSALSAVAVGWALERPPLVVIGTMGFFMFDFRIFTVYLRSTNAALGAFVLGFVLVLLGLWCAWRSATIERTVSTRRPEIHADAQWYEPW